MNNATRRDFLKMSCTLLAMAHLPGFQASAKKLRLSFSTLGCPKWNFNEILDFAVKNHYQGIEFRGIQSQLDLNKCAEFSSPENIRNSLSQIEGRGLKVVNLGSSAELHHADAGERKKQLDEARR